MSGFSRWSPGSAALLALGVTATTVVPVVVSAPASAQSNLNDVRGHWAGPFIEALAANSVIAGFPDGTFKPDQPVTRAQFAAIVRQAFNESAVRQARGFGDVPTSYWATPAIQEAYQTGFMAGYPNNEFLPNQEIPKVQVLVSLASGLRYTPTRSTSTDLSVYSDAEQIPDYAVNGVAAATEKSIVVNYPNLKFLNPNETATRGDVAAYIYQALVSQGEFQPLSTRVEASQYVVRSNQSAGSNQGDTTTQAKLTADKKIDVRFPEPIEKLYVTQADITKPFSNVTLVATKDVKNPRGIIVIPKGSQIQGEFQPRTLGSAFIGTQFVAQKLKVGSQTYDIAATSQVISGKPVDKQSLKPGSLDKVAATQSAKAALSSTSGTQSDVGSLLAVVLGGAASTQANAQTTVYSIEPATLQLNLDSELAVDAS